MGTKQRGWCSTIIAVKTKHRFRLELYAEKKKGLYIKEAGKLMDDIQRQLNKIAEPSPPSTKDAGYPKAHGKKSLSWHRGVQARE